MTAHAAFPKPSPLPDHFSVSPELGIGQQTAATAASKIAPPCHIFSIVWEIMHKC
jgi:hypothetical protein